MRHQDPIDWPYIIGRYEHNDPCWREFTLSLSFSNDVALAPKSCDFAVVFDVEEAPFVFCYVYLNPMRLVYAEHLMKQCDTTIVSKVVGEIPHLTLNEVSFQQSPNIDGTFVMVAVALGPAKNVVAFSELIVDTACAAQTRGSKSILLQLGYIAANESLSEYVSKRIYFGKANLVNQFLYRLRFLQPQLHTNNNPNIAHNINSNAFPTRERATKRRILFVGSGWSPSPRSLGRAGEECSWGHCPEDLVQQEVSIFDRFAPFLAQMYSSSSSTKQTRRLSVEFFYPYYFDEYEPPLPVLPEAGAHSWESIGITNHGLLAWLEDLEWMHSIDYLYSLAWTRNQIIQDKLQQHIQHEQETQPSDIDLNIEQIANDLFAEIIATAQKIIDFFNVFDVIVYKAEGFPLPRHMTVFANLMWLADRAKLVRYVSAVDVYLVESFDWAPCDAVVQDSNSYSAEIWYRLSLPESGSIPAMAVPPYLPAIAIALALQQQQQMDSRESRESNDRLPPLFKPFSLVPVRWFVDDDDVNDDKGSMKMRTYHLLYLGLCSSQYSPAAFVRLAKQLVDRQTHLQEELQQQRGADGIALGRRFRLAFTMLAVGNIYPSVLSLIRLYNLTNYFDLLHSDSIRDVDSVLRASDNRVAIASRWERYSLLIDPQPSSSIHAALYPLATLHSIPIVRFASSSANEWLVSGQAISVHNATIEQLAQTIVDIIAERQVPFEDLLPSREVVDAVMRLFNERNAALAVENFFYDLLRRSGWRDRFVADVARKDLSYSAQTLSPSVGPSASLALNEALFALPIGFGVSVFHRKWLRSEEALLDFAQLSASELSVLMSECSQWDKYAVIQSLHPRLELRWTPSDSDTIDRNEAQEAIGRDRKHRHRLLCIVYTYHARHDNVRAQLSTFGKRCDGFVAFSDEADASINAIQLRMWLEGGESYHNMWRKVQLMWTYVAAHWTTTAEAEGFDWFMIMGDDTYVSVPNLRKYLSEFDDVVDSQPLYLGRPMARSMTGVYNGGGAGYVLNVETLQRFLSNIYVNPKCHHTKKHSTEDVIISLCLDAIGITPMDTREVSSNDGIARERFHWKLPYEEYEAADTEYRRTAVFDVLHGRDCCANSSVSFHPISARHMQCMDLMWAIQ